MLKKSSSLLLSYGGSSKLRYWPRFFHSFFEVFIVKWHILQVSGFLNWGLSSGSTILLCPFYFKFCLYSMHSSLASKATSFRNRFHNQAISSINSSVCHLHPRALSPYDKFATACVSLLYGWLPLYLWSFVHGAPTSPHGEMYSINLLLLFITYRLVSLPGQKVNF